jgi:hypothetical protein
MEDVCEASENIQFNTERAMAYRPIASQESARDSRPITRPVNTMNSDRAIRARKKVRLQQFDSTTRASLPSNIDSFKEKFQ